MCGCVRSHISSRILRVARCIACRSVKALLAVQVTCVLCDMPGYQLHITHCDPVYIPDATVLADSHKRCTCAGQRQLRQAAMPSPAPLSSFTSYVVSLLPSTGPSYVLTIGMVAV